MVFVIIAGAILAKPSNWFIDTKHLDVVETCGNGTHGVDKDMDVGQGGFAPFGFAGKMKGAATCFYGFVGFDCIAIAGEEAKNPQRSIPLSIVFSLLFIYVAYFHGDNHDGPIFLSGKL